MIAEWVFEKLQKSRAPKPYFVGLSGPQGSGKTTLANEICEQARSAKLDAVAVSIDDFYYPFTVQNEIALRYADNPLLQTRGYPLTHDLDLALETLTQLKKIGEGSENLLIPRYDKTAFNGRGDRCKQERWSVVTRPPDLVIFEGWMLGFQPVPAHKIPNQNFEVINESLISYQQIYRFFDAFIWLESTDVDYIKKWRVDAEVKVRAQTGKGMSDLDAKRFIEKFLPAYKTYLPINLLEVFPGLPTLHLKLKADRSIKL